MRNKLDRYDAQRLMKVLGTLREIYDYNYVPSSPLSKKLGTLCRKVEGLLDTELGMEHGRNLQEEYRMHGKV